jgi:hypothetical protein
MASSWWLAGRDRAALWLLAPRDSYGAKFESAPVELPALPRGLYRVSWLDDVTGAVLREDQLRIDAGRVRVVPPPFTRHAVALVQPSPERREARRPRP